MANVTDIDGIPSRLKQDGFGLAVCGIDRTAESSGQRGQKRAAGGHVRMNDTRSQKRVNGHFLSL
jgi:hypothetical protein